MPELPPILRKKIGPLPVAAWAGLGVVAVGYIVYTRRKANATTSADATDTSSTDAVNADSAAYPYGVTGGVFGGGGGGGGTITPPDVPVTPPPSSTSDVPKGVTFGTPGNCPHGYFWDGAFCVPNFHPGAARTQPEATAPGGHGTPRKCRPGMHWNGFDCVPSDSAASGGRQYPGSRAGRR